MTKTELKQAIKEIIQEEIGGFSPQIGKTTGGTSNEFMQILTKIAKGRPEEEQEKYKVFFYVNDEDYDWDVMATSEEDAIKKVQNGEVKGPYGQSLPRLARKFSAEKV